VPRRVTTRPARTRAPKVLLAGLALIVLAGIGCGVRAFSMTGASGPGTPAGVADAGAAAQPPRPAAVLQAGSAILSGQLPSQSSATQTPPTQRRWDTNVPGIVNDPLLASRLDRALTGVDGHVGVAVKDLGSGRGAVLAGNTELQSASLYKLPVLYTVFDVGLKMSEELPITDEALSYDTGSMELGAGESLSVAEALERMVTLSDNTSAVMLGSRVGAGNVDASIAALGMTTTHYSLERMTTSPLDMLHLTEQIADGKAVSPAASADMLHLLLRQRVNDRLPRLLSDDVQVAHKTGNLPGVVNDVGVLYGPHSTVVVAALISDTTDETAAATAIAQIGLAANSYFEEQPQVRDRPLILPAPSRPVPPVWRQPHPPTPVPRPVVTVAVPRAVEATARPAGIEGSPTVVTSELGASTPAPAATGVAVGAGYTPTAAVPTAGARAATQAPAAVTAPTAAATVAAAPTAAAPAATRVPPTATPAPPAAATKAPTSPPIPPAAQPTQARTAGATVTPARR
jgi:beta-lactamase class A